MYIIDVIINIYIDVRIPLAGRIIALFKSQCTVISGVIWKLNILYNINLISLKPQKLSSSTQIIIKYAIRYSWNKWYSLKVVSSRWFNQCTISSLVSDFAAVEAAVAVVVDCVVLFPSLVIFVIDIVEYYEKKGINCDVAGYNSKVDARMELLWIFILQNTVFDLGCDWANWSPNGH